DDYATAVGGRSGNGGLGVLHRQVHVPAVGDAGRAVVLHAPGDQAVALQEAEVAAELLLRLSRGPAHELFVEPPALGRVGTEQVDPNWSADRGRFTLGHWRLLLSGCSVTGSDVPGIRNSS